MDMGALALMLGLAATIGGFILTIHKLISRFERLERQAGHRKEDTKIMLRALLACLDGLQQQGANHEVTTVYDELHKYIVDSR